MTRTLRWLIFALVVAGKCFGLILTSFFLTLSADAQSWTGILSSSRAIDWKNAGLPATFPDGETTPNPWTPPTRPACTSAQAGITVPVASGTSFSSIATALYSCSQANPAGSYLLLGSGTFNLSNYFYFAGSAKGPINNVTLRGSGPQSTTINFNANNINFQWGWSNGGNGGGTVSASPSQGATSVTITSTTGTPVVGNLAWFNQCDTGWSGTVTPSDGYTVCSTGSYADNGNLFVCGASTTCNGNGSGSGGSGHNQQQQVVVITSVTNNGSGSYTVGFSPGLYLPNWNTSNSLGFYWTNQSNFGIGDGLEDLTITFTGGGDIQQVQMANAYAAWIKGVAFIGNTSYRPFSLGAITKNSLFVNNYIFGMTPSPPSSNTEQMSIYQDSDNLIVNNILDQGDFEWDGSTEGDVFAFNYSRDVTTAYYQAVAFQHNSNSSFPVFILDEGNISNSMLYDDTWGTHSLSTSFRNWWSCGDSPYVESGQNGTAIKVDNYARFMNLIGNVLGGQSNACPNYKGNSTSDEIQFGSSDSLDQASAMLWGQYDPANGSQQFNSSEVPTGITPNSYCTASTTPYSCCTGSGTGTCSASTWNNPVPSSHTLPASFFMDSMTKFPSGGTGLDYWQICTTWTTFPTSCLATSTPPMPPIHPENSGGAYLNGYADANPAYVAYQNLPILSSYQNSYTVTGSSYSGTTETLTVSGLPSSLTNVMGGFELSGAATACTAGATLANGEILMTGSSSTTVSYTLPSNPGASCTGTLKWPDVRQFDEHVYQLDSGATLNPPTSLAAVAH
jgi:hypothetical protein